MKGVAMSAGRKWIRELYVGFLLLALSFLYLSRLNRELEKAELDAAINQLKHSASTMASLEGVRAVVAARPVL